jgi:anti-sigma factor RsiW
MANDHQHSEHCAEMFEKLSEYIDGELDRLTCKALEKHIENCVACKICLATLKKTVRLCQGLPTDTVPENFSRKLRELIQNMPATSPRLPKR